MEARSFNWHCILYSVEEYVRLKVNDEKEGLDTLSEWTKNVRCMLKYRIKRFKCIIKTIYHSIFDNLEEKEKLNGLHDQFVLVPAEKAGNNVVFVCKAHYINCI